LLGAPADGLAVLSWTAPTSNGGGAITGYNVYRRVSGGPEAALGTTAAAETTYIDMGLANGVAYTYRVAARNAAGEGAFSNPVTVVPSGSATAPTAPQGLTAEKAKGNVVAIDRDWSPPASDGGSPVATYFIYRQGPGDAGFGFLTTTTGTTTSYRDTAVERRTTYAYYVTAWNAYGPSPASSSVSVRSK
jgi:fibronectin type 3 domain-containing protein